MKKGFCTAALLLTITTMVFSNHTAFFTKTVYAAEEDNFNEDDFAEDDFDDDDFNDEDFDDEYFDDDDFDDDEDFDDEDDIVLPKIGTNIYDNVSKAWYKVIEIDYETETVFLEYVMPSNAATATIVIPEDIEADDDLYEVIKVADNAFLNNKAVKNLVISDGVRSIGSNAFKGCSKLTTVTMGQDLQLIGTSAFEGCSKLKNLTLGKGVSTIGDRAFKKCTSLTKLTIPKSVSKIGKEAFCGNKNLKSITLKSTKYTAKSFGTHALKDIHKKAVIKVPAGKSASYKHILKKAGISGKNQKIK